MYVTSITLFKYEHLLMFTYKTNHSWLLDTNATRTPVSGACWIVDYYADQAAAFDRLGLRTGWHAVNVLHHILLTHLMYIYTLFIHTLYYIIVIEKNRNTAVHNTDIIHLQTHYLWLLLYNSNICTMPLWLIIGVLLWSTILESPFLPVYLTSLL